jgi:hypothetical protein
MDFCSLLEIILVLRLLSERLMCSWGDGGQWTVGGTLPVYYQHI